ncbi:hypothetical protein [uncultured Jannaschia sp.]|uniref:hypothetical protein n=1 Tax=Jannaschia halovivens TaxID=3388667 RepID=UPI0026184883|nr:hypothetical protein [uncultured Jannaschia sp.]
MRGALGLVVLCLIGAASYADPVFSSTDVGDRPTGRITQLTDTMGEMTVDLPASTAERLPARIEEDGPQERAALRFEPYQMLDELFRPDIVFLMRHGPTDWSQRDIKDVAPTDCANQRLLTRDGTDDMIDLGLLLAANDIRPSRIVTSEWCRNQATRDALLEGMSVIDPVYVEGIDLITDPSLNLLLSLRGAPDVDELRELISAWDGGDGTGPLLVISHFTNIEELTNFTVFEGEMLMIDPKRNNRVLGYLRLRSAGPDVGHFE